MAKELIDRCFWCGKPKSGAITETEDTIRNSVINNYTPCDACKKSFNGGIHVIGVTTEPIIKGMFPISKDEKNTLYPTGSMFIANNEFIKDMLSEDSEKELLENVLRERIIMIPNDVCEKIVNDAREAQSGEEYINHMDTITDAVIDKINEERSTNEENIQNQSDKKSMA